MPDAAPHPLDGASVLVTGGTGSFGRAFCAHLLRDHDVERLAVYSRGEHAQVEMREDLSPLPRSDRLRFLIGDVRDYDRLSAAMRGVDTVVHAAALKHVPVAEYNPSEAVKTNVVGADNVARAATERGVRRVFGLSTDKAAAPLTTYGASKLVAERLLVASNHATRGPGRTLLSACRYGNVARSRGSVIHVFERAAAAGTPLPVTHQDMSRFWITLPEAVSFVASCLSRMVGGEVFVPKMPSFRVMDLARAMAGDAGVAVVGARPAEKMHEDLVSHHEARYCLDAEDRYLVEPAYAWWDRAAVGWPGVEDGFSYSSDHNDWWLDEEDLRLLAWDSIGDEGAP